ncbi:MAG: ABC transporter ATP-binding protein [Anaerolineae bacterium]
MGHMGVSMAEGKPKSVRQSLGRLLLYFKPYRGRIALIFVVLVIAVLGDLAGPYLIAVAVDNFIAVDKAVVPMWLQLLVGASPARGVGLAVTMGLLGITYVLGWFLSVMMFRLMIRMSQKVLLLMRMQIFEKLEQLSLSYFDQHEAGDLMSRLVNDTQVINDVFGPGIIQIMRGSLTIVGVFISMMLLNWRLSLMSFSVLPIFILFTMIFTKRVRSAFRATRKTIGEVSANLQENIAGVREVQAFAREGETLKEFRATNLRNRDANVTAQTLSSAFGPILQVLTTVGIVIVIGYGGYLVLGFTPPLVSIGIIVAFTNYVRRFYDPINQLLQLYNQFQSALAGAERLFELLDTVPAIQDAPDAVELPPVTGHIVYDHVSFRYTEKEVVLDDVSFEIQPGQTIAIVGPTGAGKTTIVNLLQRMYDVQSGAILIDGHDVRTVRGKSLRNQIGVVPQDTYLFTGTVMDNIRYGSLEATDEQVIEAAKLANAHVLIERFTDGYQTVLGERGATLSHGNRQLLAIARAVLKDPAILILDEATSSVDTRTELLIQKALNNLLRKRTSVVIAHRLSTIRNADNILVIDHGKIVEQGKHSELLAKEGLYYSLYMSQFRRQEETAPAAAAAAAPASS